MGTTDKKYKFLIQYEDYNPRYKQRADRYPLMCEEDNTKLKCTLEQAIQYAKDKIDGDCYTQALIMSYDPHDYSYNSGIASVSTIPPYIECKANELHLDIRDQENFYKIKEKYTRIYNAVTKQCIANYIINLDKFTDEMEFNGDKTTIEFGDIDFTVCKNDFNNHCYRARIQMISKLQQVVSDVTGVHGLEDFNPRVYKYERWQECLFDYDETDQLHYDDDEIEL